MKKIDLRGKRVVFKEKRVVTTEDFVVKGPEPDQVLVRTESSLISPGTETAFLMALPNTPKKFPMYPGYSNAGIIVATGSDASTFKPGERVVSRSNHATHVTVKEDRTLRIPDTMSFDDASFFALSSIAMQGIRKAHIELGESVVVLGQGLVGNLALQLAKLGGGMPVIGIDMFDNRLETSQKCGADLTFNPSQVSLEEAVRNATDGKGADVVVESTGNPQAVSTAIDLAGKYGRVILLGSTRGTTEVNFYSGVHRKGISVIGAHESLRPLHESAHGQWTQKDDSALALRLISKGLLKVRELVSEKISFRKADEAYKKLVESKHQVIGVILDWNK